MLVQLRQTQDRSAISKRRTPKGAFQPRHPSKTKNSAALSAAETTSRSARRLLLVLLDGEELLARLDAGGVAHYYAFRAGANMTPQDRALVDSAWRALEPVSN